MGWAKAKKVNEVSWAEQSGVHGLLRKKGLGELRSSIDDAVGPLYERFGETELWERHRDALEKAYRSAIGLPKECVEKGIGIITGYLEENSDVDEQDMAKHVMHRAGVLAHAMDYVAKVLPEKMRAKGMGDLQKLRYLEPMDIDHVLTSYYSISTRLPEGAWGEAMDGVREYAGKGMSHKVSLLAESYAVLAGAYEGSELRRRMKSVRKLGKKDNPLQVVVEMVSKKKPKGG